MENQDFDLDSQLDWLLGPITVSLTFVLSKEGVGWASFSPILLPVLRVLWKWMQHRSSVRLNKRRRLLLLIHDNVHGGSLGEHLMMQLMHELGYAKYALERMHDGGQELFYGDAAWLEEHGYWAGAFQTLPPTRNNSHPEPHWTWPQMQSKGHRAVRGTKKRLVEKVQTLCVKHKYRKEA